MKSILQPGKQQGNRRVYALAAALALLATLCWSGAQAAIGDAATLDGPLMDGKKFSLEQEKGKVVLVVLWATWCPICRRELPKLEKFYHEHAAQGFDVVAVSIDDTPKEVTEYLAKNHYSFAIGWRGRFKDNLGPVRATPTMVLLDRQGRVRLRTEGALDDGGWWAIEDEIAKKTQATAHEIWLVSLLHHVL
jgi:thiol-disulfide isomerase/thioredoxin